MPLLVESNVCGSYRRGIGFDWPIAQLKWVLCCAIFVLSASASFAADPPPAVIVPGQFNVSATGAFTYSIPIAVPPGTGGMSPTLSLDYSSQIGDGLEGLGWRLSGLPSIGRCPQTIAQDGVHGGVNYDAGDRFCLEGQRLIAVTSGTYGADGMQYRTEIEGFSKIISHGLSSSGAGCTLGFGPSYFEVHQGGPDYVLRLCRRYQQLRQPIAADAFRSELYTPRLGSRKDR